MSDGGWIDVEFGVLGTLCVTDGGQAVEVDRAKLRGVLAVLVLHANEVVAADRLAEALWGENTPPSAANTLQGYVSQLRRAIGADRIVTRAPGYLLVVDEESVDSRRFERLVAEGRRRAAAHDPVRAAEALHEALALWRGPALADLLYQPFAGAEAARLEELRLAATEELAEVDLALGRHADVATRLRPLVEEHPLREGLWAQFMLALYRCGRQADALRAFQTARRVLGEELGIEPSPALCRLEAAILTQAPSLEWQSLQPSPRGDEVASPATANVPFPVLLGTAAPVAYVGRQDLLGRLAEARARAAAGAVQAVFLCGEPGVGKTRTSAEVGRAAFDEGAVVLYGRCDEDLALPYQPFAEALDWYTAHASHPPLGAHAAELKRLQPLLAARLPGLGVPTSSDPQTEEYLLFEATASWLVELARLRPLVMVLDDLHWASKAVLLLLRHVLRCAAAEDMPVPMLVIATYRHTDIDLDHPLVDVLTELQRHEWVERRTMSGLSLAEVEELVANTLPRSPDDRADALARTVHEETDGNPFFVTEVLKHLVETGSVSQARQRSRAVDHTAVTAPDIVRDVVRRRIRRLPSAVVALLELASVLGRDFELEILAELADASESELLRCLDEADRAGLVEEIGADRYQFAHVLLRSALYQDLSRSRRRRLHQRAGEAVEKLRPGDVVALAYHFIAAASGSHDRARAVRYGLDAAEQALAARALADAEARFRQVLELVDGSSSDTNRIKALCGLGEAQRDQGTPAYRTTLLEAARLALERQDTALLVRAVLSNSRGLPSVIGGVDVERIALAEAALERVGPQPSAERARLLAQFAAELTFGRDYDRRLRLSDEAEAMARGIGDDALLAWVLNRTGYAAFSARRIERLVDRGREATELSDAGGDPTQRVLARYFWSGALLTAGDIVGFRRVTTEMLVVSEEAAPTLRWIAHATQARLHLLDGDARGVTRVNDDAFQMAQELGEPDGPAWWAAILCPLQWSRGAFGHMTELLRPGVEQYPDEPAWRIGYALSLAEAGRGAEARTVLSSDVPTPAALLDHAFPFFNVEMLPFLAFLLDDADLAAGTAQSLAPYGRGWAHQYAGSIGPVSWGLALCAAVAGELDSAVDLCEATEDVLVRAACRGLLPSFRIYYADVLVRRGRSMDRERAAELLARARGAARELGAVDLVARADEIGARIL